MDKKKELDKILKAEEKKLIEIGEKLANKYEKRKLLEAAYKAWENLTPFIKKKIPQKNNFFRDYLNKEYIEIAKKFLKEKESNEKWATLGK